MSKPLRFFITDGYPKESRDQFNEVGMRLAGILYADMIKKLYPDADCTLWYSSDPGATAPTDAELETYDGVIWPGCNLTIYHDDPRVHTHRTLVERVYGVGVPQFGSCWGIQLACTIPGGVTEPHPKGREMGLAPKIQITEAGRNHPMMEGKPPVYSGFVSHDDYVTKLPEGATLLAANDWSPVQAVEVRYKKGVFWATQYHTEYNLHEMAALIVAREPRLVKQGFFRSYDDLASYAGKLEAVHRDPDRKDIRWALKIDDDIVVDEIRELEFRNWIKYQVIPFSQR